MPGPVRFAFKLPRRNSTLSLSFTTTVAGSTACPTMVLPTVSATCVNACRKSMVNLKLKAQPVSEPKSLCPMAGQTVTDKAAPIKVSIVEDNAALRGTLAKMFSDAPGMQCVSAHATGEEAVQRIPLVNPDVALVDIHLPGMSGITCVSKLKTQAPTLQILMLTRYEQND